jgi:hypothetical protein
MRPLLLAALAAFALTPALAAEPEGLENERVATFPAKVVDLACELGGSCPPACGGGKRLLGLVDAAGVLRHATKGPVDFAGVVPDLLPFCGKTIEVDGLIIDNPKMKLFKLQRLRASAAEAWSDARGFESDWRKRNGPAEEWMRADPAVKAIIAADGVYGVPGLAPKPKEPAK